MYRFRSTRFFIGLDINPTGIRLVQLRKYSRFIMVERAINHPFEEAIFLDGKIHHWDRLQSALAEVVKCSGAKGEVAISLPLHLVRIQHMTVPVGLSQTEIETEIKTLMRHESKGATTEGIYVDFVATPQSDKRYLDILFIAARQDYLSQLIDCVQGVGLKVTAADVDVYALKRAIHFELSSHESQKQPTAIVQEHEKRLSILTFDEQGLCLQQHLDGEVDHLTPTEKERLIQSCSVFLKKRDVKRVIVCGKKEGLYGMLQAIKAIHPCQLHYPYPFSRLTIHHRAINSGIEEQPQDFLVACGLALREVSTC